MFKTMLRAGLALVAMLVHGTAWAGADNCYDAADAAQVRLWDGAAPGAVGDDPCRDIPYLRVFPAARPGGGAILLIPGGGYDRLTDAKEQAPVAEYFSRQLNLTTFVLYYRLVQSDGSYRYPVPMWDGQRALKLIRHRAAEWRVDPSRIALFGFSAGGHLASTLALHPRDDFGRPRDAAVDAIDRSDGRPDLLGLGYPVISMDPAQTGASSSHNHLLHGYRGAELARLEDYLSGQKQVGAGMVPVFLFESLDDARISAQNSVLFAQALQAAGVPADVHLFAHGVHGAGLATHIPQEQAWPELFHQWLIAQHFVPAQADGPRR